MVLKYGDNGAPPHHYSKILISLTAHMTWDLLHGMYSPGCLSYNLWSRSPPPCTGWPIRLLQDRHHTTHIAASHHRQAPITNNACIASPHYCPTTSPILQLSFACLAVVAICQRSFRSTPQTILSKAISTTPSTTQHHSNLDQTNAIPIAPLDPSTSSRPTSTDIDWPLPCR